MIDPMPALSSLITTGAIPPAGTMAASAPPASFGQTLGAFLDSQAGAADLATPAATRDTRHETAAGGNGMPSDADSDPSDRTAPPLWAAALIGTPPPAPSIVPPTATSAPGGTILSHAVGVFPRPATPDAPVAPAFTTGADATDTAAVYSPSDPRDPPRSQTGDPSPPTAAGIDISSLVLPNTTPAHLSRADEVRTDTAATPSAPATAFANPSAARRVKTLSAIGVAAPQGVAVTIPAQKPVTSPGTAPSMPFDGALRQSALSSGPQADTAVASVPVALAATAGTPAVPPTPAAFDTAAAIALDTARPRANAPVPDAGASARADVSVPLARVPNDATSASIVASAVPQPAGRVFAAALATAWRDRTQRSRDPDAAAGLATLGGVAPDPLRDAAMAQAAGNAATGALDLTRDSGLDRMIAHIETLRDDDDARDTRIRLVPDSLGGVDVAVRQVGDRVHVHFTAEQEATRALIVDAQPRLTELAAARGLRIGDTSVSADSGSNGGAAPQQRPAPSIASAPRAPAEDTEIPSDARVA